MTAEAKKTRLEAASVFDDFLTFDVDIDLRQTEEAIDYIEKNDFKKEEE
jgi:hypothetical protein